MKNIVIWIVVILVVIFGFMAFGKSTPKETGPIKIGVILPLSGDAAVYGEIARNVYQLAIEEINTAGGIEGRMMELVIEDAKCNGKDASLAAQKLVNIDKVQVIIGGFCSSESLAALPIVETAKVALISAGSSSPDLTNKSPFFFRNYPSDSSQGKVLARFAYNDKGWRTIAFLQEQTDYAAGVYKAFNEEFTALGGTVTKEEFATNATDFRVVMTKLQSLKADALFVDTQTPAQAERIFKQMQQLAYKPNLLVNDVVAGDINIITKSATALEGAFSAEFGVDTENPKFKNLTMGYKNKYGTDLTFLTYAQTEYDAVYIVRDAILKVGNNGQKIADWSRTIKDWDGASGKVTILPSGDRDGGHILKIIQEGKSVPYVK